MSKTITINGKTYDLAQLSEQALAQINNLEAADAELQRLNMQQAFVGTARNAYANALNAELAKLDAGSSVSATEDKKPAAKKAPAKKAKA